MSKVQVKNKYTLAELNDFAGTCYTNRWRIGKDSFGCLDAFIDVLRLMEKRNVRTVEAALEGIDIESHDYPL